jgi:hypothetical protein
MWNGGRKYVRCMNSLYDMSLKRYISLKRYKLHACEFTELAIPAFSLCLQGMIANYAEKFQ